MANISPFLLKGMNLNRFSYLGHELHNNKHFALTSLSVLFLSKLIFNLAKNVYPASSAAFTLKQKLSASCLVCP